MLTNCLALKSHQYITAILPVFVLVMSFSACQEQHSGAVKRTDSDSTSITVNLDDNSKISVFDIFSKISVIPLETDSNSVIEQISRVIPYDDRFYILDRKQNAVVIFDNDGNFMKKIRKIGVGPGEYSLLYDFNINPFTKELELLNPRGELLSYTIDGEFIKSQRIPMRNASKFIPITEDTIIFYTEYEQEKLHYYSRSQDKVIKKEFSFPETILNTPLISLNSSPFSQNGNHTTFFQGFTNDIYDIDTSGLRFRFRWDFGEHNLDYRDLPEGKDPMYYMALLRNGNMASCFYSYQENQSIIMTRFIFDKQWVSLIYDKADKKSTIVKRFTEDIVLPPFPVLSEEGILGYADPMEAHLLVNESVVDEPSRSVIANLKPEDNPILIRYYFKDQR
ncbi:MAG TPA: 6-bladed beta-propeller [Bacteroidales bacterium]|nr:6-bladed beta-propeller [Bacteroidales bacterium]